MRDFGRRLSSLKILGAWLTSLNGFVLVLAIIAAGFLRLLYLDTVPGALWADEITAYYEPFLVLHRYLGPNVWGLLYDSVPTVPTQVYFIVASAVQGSLWVSFFQTTSAAAVRLPAAIYGILLVPVLYLTSTRLTNHRVGLISAILGAVIPWTLFYSRYMVPIIPLEFWTLATIYLAVAGFQKKSRLLLGLSVTAGAVTTYTHFSGIAAFIFLFIPVWMWIALRLVPRVDSKESRLVYLLKLFWKVIPEIGVAALVAFPIIWFQLQPSVGPLSRSVFIWQSCGSAGCLLSSFTSRALLSWSPDFLVFTGGLTGAGVMGFSEHISLGGIYQSGGGYTGMLTILGILVYPALLAPVASYLITRENKLLALLAVLTATTYTIVGGVVTDDNPNAARLAFAAGIFVIFVAWLLDKIATQIFDILDRRSTKPTDAPTVKSHPSPAAKVLKSSHWRSTLVLVSCASVVLVCSGPYLVWYFNEMPSQAQFAFPPEVEEASTGLTHFGLWANNLVVSVPSNLSYIAPFEFGFFDPDQPPIYQIQAFNGSLAGHEGLLQSGQPTVLVSLVGNLTTNLSASGIPFRTIGEAGQDIFYRVYQPSEGIASSSVSNWIASPAVTIEPANLDWTFTFLGENVSAIQTISDNEVDVRATVSANSTVPGAYSIIATLSAPLLMSSHYLFNTSWNGSASAGPVSAALGVEVESGGVTEAGTVGLYYPSSLVNLEGSSPAPTNATIDAITLTGRLQPGTTQLITLRSITLYSVEYVTSGACVSSNALNLFGSQFDVAIPHNTSLDWNAAVAPLELMMCSGSAPPLSETYLQLTFQVVLPFTAPLDLSILNSFGESHLENITGGKGQAESVLLPIPGEAPLPLEQNQIKVTLNGRILLTSVSILTFIG